LKNTLYSKNYSIQESSAFKIIENSSCWHASLWLSKYPFCLPSSLFFLCPYHCRSSRYFLTTDGTYSVLEGTDSLDVSIVETVSVGPLAFLERSTRAKDLSLFDSTLAKNLKLLVFPTC